MIISQTPYRISFFGGGTDYPAWYEKHGGAVLSTTINKYCYITCRHLPPFFNHKHRFVWSQIELVNEVSEIKHPAIKAILQYMDQKEGLEIHHVGDLPAQSGIGSSSSFTVGLLNAMFALRGQMKSKQELGDLAIHIEQKLIKETVGSQDQAAAAFGGINRIDFSASGFSVRPVIAPPDRFERLGRSLMMFFTGISRTAAQVAQSKVENFGKKEAHLHEMRAMVDEAQGILQNREASLDEFGKLLNRAWQLKRGLSEKVSNGTIDDIYTAAMGAGSLGGKLLGAGGGGFLLFYVPLDKQDAVREKLRHLIEVDFRFENRGSQIVFYSPGMAIYTPDNPRIRPRNQV